MERLRLGIVGDVHVAPAGEPPESWHNVYDFEGTTGRLRRAAERFAEADVDGVVVLGDLAHHGDAASLDRGLACMWQAARRLWLAPGNHDPALLRHAAGSAAPGGRVAPGVRVEVLEVERGEAGYESRPLLRPGEWGDDLTLLASHFPLVSCAAAVEARGLPYAGDLADRAACLSALLARRAPTVVLSGHLHIRDTCSTGPVLQLHFPALVEHPFECSIVELDDAEGATRLRREAIALHTAPSIRDPIFVPAVECWDFDGSDWTSTHRPVQEATA